MDEIYKKALFGNKKLLTKNMPTMYKEGTYPSQAFFFLDAEVFSSFSCLHFQAQIYPLQNKGFSRKNDMKCIRS